MYVSVLAGVLLCSCQVKFPVNVPELSDGNPTTCFVGTEGVNKLIKYIRLARHLCMIRLPGL